VRLAEAGGNNLQFCSPRSGAAVHLAILIQLSLLIKRSGSVRAELFVQDGKTHAAVEPLPGIGER
jgi:hypothetical protein